MRSILALSVLTAVLVGCSSSDEPDPQPGRDGSTPPPLDGGSLDSSVGDASRPDGGKPLPDAGNPLADGGTWAATTILTRASTDTHSCTVQKDLLPYKPLTWSYTGHDLVTSQSASWLTRVEAESGANGPFNPGPSKFVVSPVDAMGKLGSAIEVPDADPSLVLRPQLLPLEDGAFALLWQQSKANAGAPGSDQQMLRFATFDARGKVVKSPLTLLTERADNLYWLRVARARDGQLAVMYSASLRNSQTTSTKLATFDAAGQMSSAPRLLANSVADAAVVAHEDGFAYLYQTLDYQADRGEIVFGKIDASGAQRGTSRTLQSGSAADTSFFAAAAVALLPVGGGFVVAWPEGSRGNDDFAAPKGGYSVLRVSRLDDTGAVVTSALLRDKVDSIDEAEPVLKAVGDSVALLWGRATHIYICGGCVSDHSMEVVLLDPATLSPRSNVAKVTAAQGGLLNKRVAVQGDTLLTALGVTFHVHSEPAFAAFRCAKK